jgi:hypothetical protein
MRLLFIAIFSLVSSAFHTVCGQTADQQKQMTNILLTYYEVKEAMIAGDATAGASKARDLMSAVQNADQKMVQDAKADKLVKDAGKLAEAKDIEKQRAVFSELSETLYTAVKSMKITGDAIYRQYCPMKKAYWLSNSKEIRNPYYGSMMMSCGKVVETINP